MILQLYQTLTNHLTQKMGPRGLICRGENLLNSSASSSPILKFPAVFASIAVLALVLGVGTAKALAQAAIVASDDNPNAALLELATKGNAKAQLQVGRIYHEGINRRRNFKQAARWFEAASASGSIEANAWLGSMYLSGRGLDRDPVRGAQLIEAAAAQGDPVGLRFSGVMRETGQGAAKDVTQAAILYQRAAGKGDASSCDHLGSLYLRGLGVGHSPTKAFDMFSQGASLGDSWAKLHLGEMYQHGHVPAEKMPPLSASLKSAPTQQRRLAQKKQSLELALKMFSDAAAQGNRVAAFKAGQMYEHGAGTDRDYEKAFSFYEQSASHRYALAQLALGRAHELGRGTSVNPLHAYVAYSLAAEQGNPLATRRLQSLVSKLSPEQLDTAQKKLKQLKELEAGLSAQ